MAVWQEIGGWRSWTKVPGSPGWRYDDQGDIEVRGVALSRRWDGAARKRARQLLPGIRAVTSDPFYVRALLTIATHESPGELPAWGDCRDASGAVVSCTADGADSPRSVGFYQFLSGTAESVGTSLHELARSASANHIAALRLAKRGESRHAKDLPTLAAQWGAGSVRAGGFPPWNVVAFRPNERDPDAYPTLSEMASMWNSAGDAIRSYIPAGELAPRMPPRAPAPQGRDNPIPLILFGLVARKIINDM